MVVRVTRATIEMASASRVSLRVTRVQGQSIFNDRTNPVRFTRTQGQVVFNDRTNPVRVTRFAAQILSSIKDAPEIIPPQPEVTIQREANPYRPVLPNEIGNLDPTLYTFMAEQVETIRDQHNVTQAGDSTFPWELLTKIGPEKQFTLGSLGRFFHDDYGIILARYCQFSKMKTPEWLNGPVGTLSADKRVTWKVTNDIKLSNPDLLVGILGSYTAPQEGWYGWVLTQGTNHVDLLLPTDLTVTRGQEIVWSDFETVNTTGAGIVIGRTLDANKVVGKWQNQLPAGSILLRCEGPSHDSLKALMGDQYNDVVEQIKAVQETLDSLDPTNLITNLNKLVDAFDLLDARVKTNESNWSDLRKRLTKLEASQSDDALYLRITGETDNKLKPIDRRLGRLENQVQSIPGLVQAIRDVSDHLDLIQEALNTVQETAANYLIPVVDGGIPPQLVYLPTGELIFVKEKVE